MRTFIIMVMSMLLLISCSSPSGRRARQVKKQDTATVLTTKESPKQDVKEWIAKLSWKYDFSTEYFEDVKYYIFNIEDETSYFVYESGHQSFVTSNKELYGIALSVIGTKDIEVDKVGKTYSIHWGKELIFPLK